MDLFLYTLIFLIELTFFEKKKFLFKFPLKKRILFFSDYLYKFTFLSFKKILQNKKKAISLDSKKLKYIFIITTKWHHFYITGLTNKFTPMFTQTTGSFLKKTIKYSLKKYPKKKAKFVFKKKFKKSKKTNLAFLKNISRIFFFKKEERINNINVLHIKGVNNFFYQLFSFLNKFKYFQYFTYFFLNYSLSYSYKAKKIKAIKRKFLKKLVKFQQKNEISQKIAYSLNLKNLKKW